MTFLILAADASRSVDTRRLQDAAAGQPITWFDTDNPGLGGGVCLSPLATIERLPRSEGPGHLLIGRVRLDRRDELARILTAGQQGIRRPASDAELCLLAYDRWGLEFVAHIHGDFAFGIFDSATHEVVCVRDRLGVRSLAWVNGDGGTWVAGSIGALINAATFDKGSLDAVWISDFLATGLCEDMSRTVYSSIRKLPPAHLAIFGAADVPAKSYWSLNINAPLQLGSAGAYLEAFHGHLDAAVTDRLPPDRLGIMLSGGLDSGTLAAKARELDGGRLQIFAQTWLSDTQDCPEEQPSRLIAERLGLEQTFVDAGNMLFNASWQARATAPPEPSLSVLSPSARFANAQSMQEKAAYWFYGEGPDNALTFDWREQIAWLTRHRQWRRLAGAAAAYLASKPLSEWANTIASRLRLRNREPGYRPADCAWVRSPASSPGPDAFNRDWRPEVQRNLASARWPAMFEWLDEHSEQAGIEWRHPFLDLRLLEFMLATPPIPWARDKRLIRRAMQGRLPDEILRRPKTPVAVDPVMECLRRHPPAMPRPGDAIEEFVDLSLLPNDPATFPDVYAVLRVAILQHWLKARLG